MTLKGGGYLTDPGETKRWLEVEGAQWLFVYVCVCVCACVKQMCGIDGQLGVKEGW